MDRETKRICDPIPRGAENVFDLQVLDKRILLIIQNIYKTLWKGKLPPLSAELAVKADYNYQWNQGAGAIEDQFIIDSFLRSFYFNDSF